MRYSPDANNHDDFAVQRLSLCVEEQGYITVTVPSILDIEVIASDWPSGETTS